MRPRRARSFRAHEERGMKPSKENPSRPLRVGAVAYDPKVVTIWEGFRDYFAKRGVEIDYVLYSNYDAQVLANLSAEIDVAWNSPLAWVKSQLESQRHCRALAMRDTDRDLTTKILARKDSGITTLGDLKRRAASAARASWSAR